MIQRFNEHVTKIYSKCIYLDPPMDNANQQQVDSMDKNLQRMVASSLGLHMDGIGCSPNEGEPPWTFGWIAGDWRRKEVVWESLRLHSRW
jgi:hypothetical protein